jgi:hypothetical protein
VPGTPRDCIVKINQAVDLAIYRPLFEVDHRFFVDINTSA